MTNECKFFILAGGYGKRAQPLSLIKPKPLFPLGGTPLIKILLEQLQEKGLTEGLINLHYMPGPLRRCVEEITGKPGSPLIRLLVEKKLSGSRILRKAASYMRDTDLLLVVNGDIFLEIPIAEMRSQLFNDQVDGILLARKNKARDTQYKILLTHDHFFSGRKVWPDHESESGVEPLMYTGVALFTKNVVRASAEINFFDMLARKDFKIKVVVYDGIWLDIGDPRSYLEANFAYTAYFKSNRRDANCLSANVVIAADSRVEHSVVWENTHILNKSVLSHCLVTGNITLDNVNFLNKIITRDSIQEGIML